MSSYPGALCCSSGHTRRGILLSGAKAQPGTTACQVCTQCVDYEKKCISKLSAEVSDALRERRERGSAFDAASALESFGGLGGSIEAGESLSAFALLAPPIAFKNTAKGIVTSSAAKLYFVITHSRRLLELRRSTSSLESDKWYLSKVEFENILLASGVDWMERWQIWETHAKLDLNHSGHLHVTEMLEVLRSAESVCRSISNGRQNLNQLVSSLLRRTDQYPSSCLVSQLRALPTPP